MPQSHSFIPGDFLVFQVESAFALLRVLEVEMLEGEPVWHLAAYGDMFMDVETADIAASSPSTLQVDIPHVALTNRAFESTQISRLGNVPLEQNDLVGYRAWADDGNGKIEDRSIRLILGLR